MIHQLIFAHPKPGMSERAFQNYWKEVHAVRYASKIPQICKYLVASRLPCGPEPDDPLWGGVAEIWFRNEKEQLASLQSPEFLEGARLDEPRWAAFWRTVVLDTESRLIREERPPSRDMTQIKLWALVKRKEGMSLEAFRRHSLEVHAPLATRLPGLRRYVQCHVRDTSYALGETLLDCVSMLWFDDVASLQRALDSPENRAAAADLESFVHPRYRHTLVTDETWIIGPEPRETPAG